MVTSNFRPEVEIRPFRACAMKNMQYNHYSWPSCENVRALKEIGVMTSYFRSEVEMPYCACAMHPVITVEQFVAMGRYHVPQNAFLVSYTLYKEKDSLYAFN